MTFHIAQLNIAEAKAPIDSELMAPFVNELDRINALAESSPGFVWRLKEENGNATSIQIFDDPNLILNMSIWETKESLFEYVYKSAHAGVMSRRREWFEPMKEAYHALWWIEAGKVPSLEEAKAKLEYLQKNGPTEHAFTFKKSFPVPTQLMQDIA